VWQPDSISYLCARALDEDIETSYVRMLIAKRHLLPPESPRPGAGWPWPVRIHVLGRLEIVINDEPVTFQGKVPRKPLELLRAIIALGVRGRARESRIIDALWPDAEGDAGRFALTTTLHRLRRLLGHEGAVLRQDEQIGFDARLCWVDALELQTILDRAEALRTESDEQWRVLDHYVASVVMLYRGPLVSTDGAPAWARPFDSALRRRLVRHVIRLASHRQQRKQWEIAADLYERALAIEPSDGTALAALSTCRVERLRGEESGV
jgi:DNA-binding SARP family transcriptional activator